MGGAHATSSSATYRVLRELGARTQHTYAAVHEPHELVVAQRFSRAKVGPETLALLLRDARCLAKNWHPNVARVRHVDLVDEDLVIATELVDGVTLKDFFNAAAHARKAPADPLITSPVLVRILLDVLGGLHGLHGLRDAANTPLGMFHGELCPTNIVVGKDGVTRLVTVFRPRPVSIEAGSEALRYAAPEALDLGGASDPRADVYAVGVILWEALAGKRLYSEKEPARILQRQREDDAARPEVTDPAFEKLADVAMRALSFDASLRFRTASEMMAEIRRIAGANLAQGMSVASKVTELAGERIKARRQELDLAVNPKRRNSGSIAAVTTEATTDDASDRMSAPPATVRGAIPEPPSTRNPLTESSGKMRAAAPAKPDESKPQIKLPPRSDPKLAIAKPDESKPQIKVSAIKSEPKLRAAAPVPAPPAVKIPETLPGLGGPAPTPAPAPIVKKPPPPISRTPAPPVAVVEDEEPMPISSSALLDAPPSDQALPILVLTTPTPTPVLAAPVVEAKPTALSSPTPVEHVVEVAPPPRKKRIAPLAIVFFAFLCVAIVIVFVAIALKKPPEDLTKELARPPSASVLATPVPPPPPAPTETAVTTATPEPVAPPPTASETTSAVPEPPPPPVAETTATPPPPPPRPIVKKVPYEPLGI